MSVYHHQRRPIWTLLSMQQVWLLSLHLQCHLNSLWSCMCPTQHDWQNPQGSQWAQWQALLLVICYWTLHQHQLYTPPHLQHLHRCSRSRFVPSSSLTRLGWSHCCKRMPSRRPCQAEGVSNTGVMLSRASVLDLTWASVVSPSRCCTQSTHWWRPAHPLSTSTLPASAPDISTVARSCQQSLKLLAAHLLFHRLVWYQSRACPQSGNSFRISCFLAILYTCLYLILVFESYTVTCMQSVPSVNAGIHSINLPTAWGTFTNTSALVLSLPPGCVSTTFDVSAAYQITPVHPSQQHALCIAWQDSLYLDTAAPSGLQSSAGVFGSIANMLVDIYSTAGFGLIHKWVDGFFVIWLPSDTWTKYNFMELTGKLGVPWSALKLRMLASIQRYIRLDWNLNAWTVSMPPKKTIVTLQLVSVWLLKERQTKVEAACLHRKLVHLATMYPLIHLFLCLISCFASGFKLLCSALAVPPSVCSDITWILEMIPLLPPKLPLSCPDPLDIGWWGDVSTSFGVGVVVGAFWGGW
jgi:hypothetical protein